jgi:flagellar biosynthetic protein FliP
MLAGPNHTIVPGASEASDAIQFNAKSSAAKSSSSELLESQSGKYVAELQNLADPSRIGSSLKLILTMSVISLAPAILLMTTSFIRISIVLGLLRQAFGAQQLPPNQVLTSLSLFMTMMIMWPVWTQVYDDAVKPYSDPDSGMTWQEAWQTGIEPVRNFMIQQIETTGNTDDVRLFVRHAPGATENPASYDEVPTQALLPAFVLSELKTSFLLGFQIYLPFLIIDIVVATLTMSMGMVMLPPTMMSLPLKLLLFVLVDGWHLLVGMLLESFSSQTM